MNLKKIGKVFTSKFVGTGPSSYKNRIYRAAVSQRLRNTGVGQHIEVCETGCGPRDYDSEQSVITTPSNSEIYPFNWLAY